MKINPDEHETALIYKLMTGTIVPRPIGWISTIDENGTFNLAPYSFFNAMSADPPHVVFGSGRRAGANKDTVSNILETGEFVVNLVTEPTAEAMNVTATETTPEVDEFRLANLTPLPSEVVKAPRVGESTVNFECKMVHHYQVQGSRGDGSMIVIGQVVMMHVDDDILGENNRIDYGVYKPVGRLAGSGYCRVSDIFDLERPPSQLA
ncbi:MAG: flavin reductase family protein [Chloroflexota bacterium]